MPLFVASRIMARTTIDLDPLVIRRLRERAKLEGKSMGQVASELLVRVMAAAEPEPPLFEWKSYNMGLPLIDLEDKDALYRILDEEE